MAVNQTDTPTGKQPVVPSGPLPELTDEDIERYSTITPPMVADARADARRFPEPLRSLVLFGRLP
jgi:hypothetical protein